MAFGKKKKKLIAFMLKFITFPLIFMITLLRRHDTLNRAACLTESAWATKISRKMALLKFPKGV